MAMTAPDTDCSTRKRVPRQCGLLGGTPVWYLDLPNLGPAQRLQPQSQKIKGSI